MGGIVFASLLSSLGVGLLFVLFMPSPSEVAPAPSPTPVANASEVADIDSRLALAERLTHDLQEARAYGWFWETTVTNAQNEVNEARVKLLSRRLALK